MIISPSVIYAFCDASLHIEWNLSKNQSKKNNTPRKKLFKVGCGGYQYNIPLGGTKLETFQKNTSNVTKIEAEAIHQVILDIISNVNIASHIVIYTDQEHYVEKYKSIISNTVAKHCGSVCTVRIKKFINLFFRVHF